MKNRTLRLSTRLYLSFGALVAILTLTSGFALLKMADLEEQLDRVVTVNNVKTTLLGDMLEQVHVVSRVIRSIALLEDEQRRGVEQQKIVAARAAYDKARAELERFVPNEAARAMRAAIDGARDKVRPLNDKVLALVQQSQRAEATALLLDQAGPATTAWQEAIDANLEAQTRSNAEGYAEAKRDYRQGRNALLAASLLGLLVAGTLAWRMVRGLTRELGGEPAEVLRVATAIADADLATPIVVRPGDDRSVTAAMARMQRALADMVSRVRSNAESVATASSQIAQGNQDLSQRTEEQASALQQTAATMEQLGTTVRHNADSAARASQLAQGACQVASEGGSVVDQVVETMKGIDQSSQKIADIIGVIDGIAFQTNILALNAAVEAARAGEQGRGFAVVAAEVRALAQRSAGAAREIKSLITHSVEQVQQGSALVDQAGHTMQEIVGAIRRVSDIVGEISAANQEQSAGVGQVGQAVSQMDQVTQQNAALVEESAAAAESLKQQAGSLVEAVAVFKVASTAGQAVSA
ncbi:methyl-accepting chemotaxis protein [Aquabacterium sp.]|uniref:methyl-accepting chemotaxis protein n=1 Tax=Aquabacterium sp. TaxID=1872578 RepID=UPI0037845014